MTTAIAKTKQPKVLNKMQISRRQMTIKNIIKNRKKIRFDLAIQRNTVWKETTATPQKSKLIDSILRNFPIPQVFAIASEDDIMWMADGKQRWTTILGYIDNEFPLAKGVKPIVCEDGEGELAEFDAEGKFFKDLDKALQEQILDYEMDIREIRGATPAQVEELFVRLNNGSPLTKMEMTRATVGSETQTYINEVSALPFFHDMAFISDSSRNRFVDQEMIMQILMLAMGRETGLSTKEVSDFAIALRENGIPEDLRKLVNGTTLYLQDAFTQFITINAKGEKEMPVLNKILKKIHIPMLFMTAIDSINADVQPEVFGVWARIFLLDEYKPGVGAYASKTVAGSAKKENVQGRLKVMKADFAKRIEAVKTDWLAGAEERAKIAAANEAAASAENSKAEEGSAPEGTTEGTTEENGDNGEKTE